MDENHIAYFNKVRDMVLSFVYFSDNAQKVCSVDSAWASFAIYFL